jgi:hypothetical protein
VKSEKQTAWRTRKNNANSIHNDKEELLAAKALVAALFINCIAVC